MYMNIAFDNVCFKGSIVSQSARFVYMCLCKHADSTHQTCFPSISRIAEIVGKSISTVKRAVRELCKYGAIERNPRFRKDGGQTSNLYKVAQVDLGSLAKVADNSINKEIDPEQIGDQDTTTENISLSESKTDNESACACTTTDNDIDQGKYKIEESIKTELESDIQSQEETEFEEIHNCIISIKQQNIEINETKHMINSNVDKNINTELRSINWINALHIAKKSVFKVIKTISTKILTYKSHSYRHNGLGGGHGWPPKNLSN